MAQELRFICNNCDYTASAWSDGNPYYIDEKGEKQYAYHPRHDLLARCIGNDTPHTCLECGSQFNIDSRQPISACPKCGSNELVGTFDLEGKQCPKCKADALRSEPGGIS